MKVLTLSYEYPPLGGGGGRVAQGLAKQLGQLGHQIDLVTMGFDGLPGFESGGGVRIYRTSASRRQAIVCRPHEMLLHQVKSLPLLIRLVREMRYGLCHAHFIVPDGALAYALHRATGLPYLLTAHGSDVPGYNPDRFNRRHRLLAPLWRQIVASARHVVCPSRALEELVRRHSRAARTCIVPNGFDAGRFGPRCRDRSGILIVTRMLERKGVQHVLRALDGLDIGQPLRVVGDGPYLPTLRALAAGVDADIRFYGWLHNDSAELRRLYETSRIFVLASSAENFPVSLLEAMAAKLAIVTSAGTGCEEVVGDAAVVVTPGDSGQIREALRTLSHDAKRCRELGRSARSRLESTFGWLEVGQQYDRLYRAAYLRGDRCVQEVSPRTGSSA